jgi:hypothetical protein
MSDKRSERKSSMTQFLTRLDKDRLVNLASLIEKAKQLEMAGFDRNAWDDEVWTITAGRLIKQSGRNVNKMTLGFSYAPKLEGGPLAGEWADVVKALMVVRFHREQQAIENQRNFIAAVGYLSFEMAKKKLRVFRLTPEVLDLACEHISTDYSKGSAYNMHKALGEFAAHCDANGLCNVLLDYKYSGMKRPDNTGGLGHKRLDDPETLNTKGDKLVDPNVFKIIGELYKNVPADHKYRFYVLILTLLAMLGRRFSEISLLPYQILNWDDKGRAYLKYFPRKTSTGDVLTPCRNLYLPSDVVDIVKDVISELNKSCSAARETAAEMAMTKGPDLSFLIGMSDEERLYKKDLKSLGIPEVLLDTTGWLRKNGFAFPDENNLTAQGKLQTVWFTTKAGVIAYCKRDFHESTIEPIHIDQAGEKYYLKDMLLVRHLGLSSGFYAHWVATQCTHSMMTTFLRYFPALAEEYASSSIEVDFTSHHFRHTLNTLLDEGGLSDLLQTAWFDRSNSRDTKAYQHTSREKRALLLREDIKAGRVGGRLAEQIKRIPISLQDAVLAARVHAVHDVGAGICVHNFVQTPCDRHLQCSAECDDYVWAKGDEGRKEELKRLYAVTVIARETAELMVKGRKPKKSADWVAHNDKKMHVLFKQMKDYGIEPFDPHEYLRGRVNE